MLETLKQWDKNLFIWLNNLGVEDYDSFWVFATKIENWTALYIFFLTLLVYYLKPKKGVVTALFLIATFFLTLALTDLTKYYISRVRPNNVEALSDLIRVLQKPTSFSFFSGHASTSFSIVTFMVLSLRRFNKWIYVAFLWPLIFVMSRIYVGVHYPSDILVGAFVGTIMAFLGYKVSQLVIHRFLQTM